MDFLEKENWDELMMQNFVCLQNLQGDDHSAAFVVLLLLFLMLKADKTMDLKNNDELAKVW